VVEEQKKKTRVQSHDWKKRRLERNWPRVEDLTMDAQGGLHRHIAADSHQKKAL
jgi:hypothetical protein